MKRALAYSLMALAFCTLTSCRTPPPDSSTAKCYGLDPRKADLVALCDVREGKYGIAHTIKEVWKGQELLPNRLRSDPNGKILVMSKAEPNTTVPRSALVCFKNRPGSDNILTNNLGCTTFYIESGRISPMWEGAHEATVTIRTLRSDIKK